MFFRFGNTFYKVCNLIFECAFGTDDNVYVAFVGQAFVELFVAVGRLVVIPRRLGIENGSSRLCAHLADVDGGAVAEGARVTVPVT